MARPPALDPLILTAALQGLETQLARVNEHIAAVQRMLGNRPVTAAGAGTPGVRPKRVVSAAARRRMAAAQRRRWATVRGAAEQASKAPAAPEKAARPKRKLSAAGRKRIIDALKKRWAAIRAKAAEAEKAVARKVAKKATPPAAKKVQARKAAKVAGGTDEHPR